MHSVIKTSKSELTYCEITDQKIVQLIGDIVKIIDSELIENLEIIIYGKVCHQHRNIGFFSDKSKGYKYSNNIVHAKPLDTNLEKLLRWVNYNTNSDYNGILVNKYKDGVDYIGKHSDDEKELDRNGGVTAISFGQSRKFRVREKSTGKIVVDHLTGHCELMQMLGHFQKEFTHEIPIEKKIKKPRYSFTFRSHTI